MRLRTAAAPPSLILRSGALGNVPAPVFSVVDKTFDTGRAQGEETAGAAKRGALANLYPPKQAVTDPSGAVGEAMLRRQFNQKENP
jgi:hypothetical protein